jgi:hypothetical protein
VQQALDQAPLHDGMAWRDMLWRHAQLDVNPGAMNGPATHRQEGNEEEEEEGGVGGQLLAPGLAGPRAAAVPLERLHRPGAGSSHQD